MGRDAVDAGGAKDEGACLRTAKSCGSDASTPASSLREEAQMTVTKKPDRRGEREISRKTIARGMPGDSGVTVVTNSSCFVLFCTRGCGCIGRPAFPAPSDSRGQHVQGKTRVDARRDREAVSREVRGCLKLKSPAMQPGTNAPPMRRPREAGTHTASRFGTPADGFCSDKPGRGRQGIIADFDRRMLSLAPFQRASGACRLAVSGRL